MAVIARLNFDTVIGDSADRIDWQLDILDESSQAVTPLDLIGDGDSPFVINYHKDQDIYKPILGSSAKINLWVPNDTYLLPDFNAGTPFQYEVRLRRVGDSERSIILAASTSFGPLTLVDSADNIGTRSDSWFMNSAITGGTWPASDFISINGNSDILNSADTGDTILLVMADGEYVSYRVTAETSNEATIPTGTRDTRQITRVNMSANAVVGDFTLYTGTTVANYHASSAAPSTVDYWCGYINPIESKEKIGTFPFPVSFTATDRLGLLGQQSLIRANVVHDPTLLGYIGRALRQTGLELPIYIDSGVRNANGDALLDVSASPFSFFDEDFRTVTSSFGGDRATLRESLIGVLETFNCRLFQADGKWWIVNCSTHGTNTTYAQFIPDVGMTGRDSMNRFPGDTGYTATTNVEDYIRSTTQATVTIPTLVYELNGTSTEDLSVVNEDYLLTLREPFGSVEARPETLTQDPLHPNPDFTNTTEGWSNRLYDTSTSTSLDVLEFTPVDDLTNTLSGTRAITTNRNLQRIGDVDQAVWFRNSLPIEANPNSPTTVRFDWKYNNVTAGRDIRIPFRIRLELDTPITLSDANAEDIVEFLNPDAITVNQLYWNFNDSVWDVGLASGALQTNGILGITRNEGLSRLNVDSARGQEENEWQEVSTTIDAFATFENSRNSIDLSSGSLYVEFFFPQAYRGDNGKRALGGFEGNFDVFIDNVTITDEVPDDLLNPVYEYRQPSHTLTEEYSPAFVSTGPSTFRQFLLSDGDPVGRTDFWNTSETSTDGRTLERLVTGQKLADNKERLRYYEGRLLNRNLIPIGMHNQIMVNYDGFDETNGTYILNGGTFNVKQNTFDIAGYIGDASDLVLTGDSRDIYEEFNVDLISQRFAGRRQGVRYTLGIIARGLVGNTVRANSITTNIMNDIVDVIGRPGDIVTKEITLTPGTGLVSSSGSTVRPDTTTEPRPFYTTYQTDDNGLAAFDRVSAGFNQPTSAGASSVQAVAGSIVLPVSITIPDDDDFEELHIDVAVTDFVPEQAVGVEEYNITLRNNVTGTVGAGTNISIPVIGTGGNTVKIPYTFAPVSPLAQELLIDNLNDPTESGTTGFSILSNVEKQVGGSVEVEIDYEIVSGGDAGATITYTGNTIAIDTADNPAFTFSGAFQPSIPVGYTFSDTTYSHRGRNPATFDGLTVLEPTEGNFLTASGFSQSGTTAGISNVRFEQAGENVVLRYTATFEATNATGRNITVTTDATAVREEPYSITYQINNLGGDGFSTYFTTSGSGASFTTGTRHSTHRIGYNQGDTTIPSANIVVESNSGMMFSATTINQSTSEVLVDINEVSVINTDTGARVALPEPQFTITTATTPLTNGNLNLIIDGTPPSVGGNYVIDVNILASAITVPATLSGTTLTRMSQNLPAMGGSAQFSLVADGDWEIVAEVLGGGDGTVNTAGSYSESLTIAGLTITTTGTFGPISGGAGTHTITVEADPRPFAFGPVQADGSINFSAFVANNGVQLEVVAPGTTTALSTAQVVLINALGGRTVTLPAGVNEATLMSLSQSFENWTFQS